MKNKVKNIPSRLTGLTKLSKLPHHSFWADGAVWGCTEPVLCEAVVFVEGLKDSERMQVLIRYDRRNAPEVKKLLDGLDHAKVHYWSGPCDPETLHELLTTNTQDNLCQG